MAGGAWRDWWDFDGTLVSRPLMWSEVALRLLERHAPDSGVTQPS